MTGFRVVDHRLEGCWSGPSPNHDGPMVPRFIILHYTAMDDVDAVERWLCNPDSKVSAHLIVGRDGAVRQIVPFNTIAWHAGVSRWGDLVGLNQCSIGIELVNLGWLDQVELAGCSREGLDFCVPFERVIAACHAQGGPERRWERFDEAQLETLDRLIPVLRAAYPSIEAVLGHDEVAPGRKEDPGPAFPWERYR
ncbi:MAG: N-acetylmuramoyl-L-alanine amidase [Pseudomonadota bacterium]